MRDELTFETIITGYGLTESCGIATMCRFDDDPETIATTSGRAIPDVEVLVVDEAGTEVPRGEPGEVVVRGYNVMRGYLDDPAETAATIDDDGWLHTGDVGVMDDRGYLRITDRTKDMFIVGGFNAYPAEIENLLLRNPAIAQVAVVGVPDARMGEVGDGVRGPAGPGATATADEIIAWSREVMANFKVPRAVEIVAELPLNASGKVLKTELRDPRHGRGQWRVDALRRGSGRPRESVGGEPPAVPALGRSTSRPRHPAHRSSRRGTASLHGPCNDTYGAARWRAPRPSTVAPRGPSAHGESVVDAVLELVGGQARPTAREIADAAGISVRSVYVHFDDLDDLFRAAADRHFERMASLLEPVDAALPLRRPDHGVGRPADPDPRALRRRAPGRRAVGAAVAGARRGPAPGPDVGRQDIERLFGEELVGRADHDTTLSAVTLLLGAEAWDSLRAQGLSVGAARDVVVQSVTRLLEPR